MAGNRAFELWIYDLRGRALRRTMIQPESAGDRFRIQLDIRDLTDGTYWIWIERAGRRMGKRFVKAD